MNDMASRRSGLRTSHRQRGWLGFFVGLALGLFVALLVYLQGAGVRSVPQLALPGPQPTEAGKPQQTAEVPPTAAVSKAPKFDFYSILPESETKAGETAPEQTRAQKKTDDVAMIEGKNTPDKITAERASPAESGETTSLQVGSFQKREDAERVKAKLALLGLSAEVRTVKVNGSEAWYRVMSGPYADANRLLAVRRRLEENNLSYLPIKEKN